MRKYQFPEIKRKRKSEMRGLRFKCSIKHQNHIRLSGLEQASNTKKNTFEPEA